MGNLLTTPAVLASIAIRFLSKGSTVCTVNICPEKDIKAVEMLGS